MKRFILTVALAVAAFGVSFAQNCMVVNSEKIFKSIAEYNNAISTLDQLAEQYQQQVDAKFQEVEALYNAYMAQKSALSESARQSRESAILQKEKEAGEFQESIFGQEGSLMKRRKELIQPIQDRVFKAIAAYAERKGFDLVVDSASNPTLLYSSGKIDHTEGVIQSLN